MNTWDVEQARKRAQDISKRLAAESKSKLASNSSDEPVVDIVINDCPNRVRLVQSRTIKDLEQRTGTTIQLRGKYIGPSDPPSKEDYLLYLRVSASDRVAVNRACNLIDLQRFPEPYSGKVYVPIPQADWRVLVGKGFINLKHIRDVSGTKINIAGGNFGGLKGRIPEHVVGLHFDIRGNTPQMVEHAKVMVGDLMEAVLGIPAQQSRQIPPVQGVVPPVQQGMPPVQQGMPPVQQGMPPVQQGMPPAQQGIQGMPPVQQGMPPAQRTVQNRYPLQNNRTVSHPQRVYQQPQQQSQQNQLPKQDQYVSQKQEIAMNASGPRELFRKKETHDYQPQEAHHHHHQQQQQRVYDPAGVYESPSQNTQRATQQMSIQQQPQQQQRPDVYQPGQEVQHQVRAQVQQLQQQQQPQQQQDSYSQHPPQERSTRQRGFAEIPPVATAQVPNQLRQQPSQKQQYPAQVQQQSQSEGQSQNFVPQQSLTRAPLESQLQFQQNTAQIGAMETKSYQPQQQQQQQDEEPASMVDSFSQQPNFQQQQPSPLQQQFQPQQARQQPQVPQQFQQPTQSYQPQFQSQSQQLQRQPQPQVQQQFQQTRSFQPQFQSQPQQLQSQQGIMSNGDGEPVNKRRRFLEPGQSQGFTHQSVPQKPFTPRY